MKPEDQKSTYISWLNDAHAMELGLVTVLEKQVAETEGQPDMQVKIKQHLAETKRHAELIEACVVRNGGTVSAAKDFISKTTAVFNGLGMSMMNDVMVKNVHASYAAEHFEIATYTVLQAAAEECGDTETVSVCDTIIDEEINMANWLIEQLPMVVQKHLAGEV